MEPQWRRGGPSSKACQIHRMKHRCPLRVGVCREVETRVAQELGPGQAAKARMTG